jgi:membrane protein YdbS with pleckstrin-like domain
MEAASHPVVDDVEQQLDPRFVDLQRLRNTIVAAVLTAVLGVPTLILWAAIGLWLAGLVLVPLWLGLSGVLFWHLRRWPGIAYKHASYRVDDMGIEIRKGVYWRRVTSVPRSRVQHTDVSQGPLERRFGLGTLVIHTAGTMNANVSVAGLEYGTAQRIRAQLMPRSDGDAV